MRRSRALNEKRSNKLILSTEERSDEDNIYVFWSGQRYEEKMFESDGHNSMYMWTIRNIYTT